MLDQLDREEEVFADTAATPRSSRPTQGADTVTHPSQTISLTPRGLFSASKVFLKTGFFSDLERLFAQAQAPLLEEVKGL